MKLTDQLDAVIDQSSFVNFVYALVEDRKKAVASELAFPRLPYGSDSGGWENVTIEDFLAAATEWAVSTRFGETLGLSSTNPWKQFAVFLYSGKIYE